MSMIIFRILSAVLLLSFLSSPAAAKILVTKGDWTADHKSENGKALCVLSAEPQNSTGKYSKRGLVFLLITHRPAESRFHEVSFQAGYTYAKGSEVKVTIDRNTKFSLFTDGGHAWTVDEKTDRALVKAMRAGGQMTVIGKSSRGTLTTDTFSLTGFTAASKAINRACKAK